MASVIEIDGVSYPGYIEDEPESLTTIDRIESRKYFYKINSEDYKDIPKNDTVYYCVENNIYNSGKMLKFIEPNVFVLYNPQLLYIWSIQLEDNSDIYVKDYNRIRNENRLMTLVFKEYKKLQGITD